MGQRQAANKDSFRLLVALPPADVYYGIRLSVLGIIVYPSQRPQIHYLDMMALVITVANF